MTRVNGVVDIWDVVEAERQRAHRKHGASSLESLPVDDLMRLSVLMEEVGEVAREFNEARHRGTAPNLVNLGTELVQVAAMAGAWADACATAERARQQGEALR